MVSHEQVQQRTAEQIVDAPSFLEGTVEMVRKVPKKGAVNPHVVEKRLWAPLLHRVLGWGTCGGGACVFV